MKKVLIPLPENDFDPTEASVPWKILRHAGVSIQFATPRGNPAQCDPRMLNGTGLGLLAPLLSADRNAREAYREMTDSEEFNHTLTWNSIQPGSFDGILLPGGHAKEMREYLESEIPFQ